MIGECFQRNQVRPLENARHTIDWNKKPVPYKEYSEARKVVMDKPRRCGDMTLFGKPS
ncbi:MAG: hypothetical protein MZV70_54225 [Desulfobacterales bacterium]|nr:hypothetical protein [Desulfobacterales bacterium]